MFSEKELWDSSARHLSSFTMNSAPKKGMLYVQCNGQKLLLHRVHSNAAHLRLNYVHPQIASSKRNQYTSKECIYTVKRAGHPLHIQLHYTTGPHGRCSHFCHHVQRKFPVDASLQVFAYHVKLREAGVTHSDYLERQFRPSPAQCDIHLQSSMRRGYLGSTLALCTAACCMLGTSNMAVA